MFQYGTGNGFTGTIAGATTSAKVQLSIAGWTATFGAHPINITGRNLVINSFSSDPNDTFILGNEYGSGRFWGTPIVAPNTAPIIADSTTMTGIVTLQYHTGHIVSFAALVTSTGLTKGLFRRTASAATRNRLQEIFTQYQFVKTGSKQTVP